MVQIVAKEMIMCAGHFPYSGGSGCVSQGSALPVPSGRFYLWEQSELPNPNPNPLTRHASKYKVYKLHQRYIVIL